MNYEQYLNIYNLSNFKFKDEFIVNKILLKHALIYQEMETYLHKLSVKQESIIRLRTNTYKNLSTNIAQEIEINEVILNFELKITADKVIYEKQLYFDQLNFLNELINENRQIGFTRKTRFNELTNKINQTKKFTIENKYIDKIKNNVNLLHELFSDIKIKLVSQNESMNLIIMKSKTIKNKCYSLEECSVFFDVSRERIRQIEKRALEKLKCKYNDDNNQHYAYLEKFEYQCNVFNSEKYFLIHPVSCLFNSCENKLSPELFFQKYKLIESILCKSYITDNKKLYLKKTIINNKVPSILHLWLSCIKMNGIKIDKLLFSFNEFLITNNLHQHAQLDKRSIEGLLERNKFVAKSTGHYILVDENKINLCIKYFEQVVKNAEDFFSVKIIFDALSEKFLEIGVLNFHYLHNILKKNYESAVYTFNRTPYVSVNQKSIIDVITKYRRLGIIEENINSHISKLTAIEVSKIELMKSKKM